MPERVAPVTAATAPFIVTDTTIDSPRGPHPAMVVTPKSLMQFDRARLNRLKQSAGLSPAEHWLIEQARQRGEGASIIVFRAVGDKGNRLWAFGEDLDESEFGDAGFVFTKALLPLHRRLLAAGVMLMIHTDWGGHTCYAMRHGGRMLLDQRVTSMRDMRLRALDSWLLKHMLVHVALSFDHVKRVLLPDYLPMLSRRRERVQRLLADLPSDALA